MFLQAMILKDYVLHFRKISACQPKTMVLTTMTNYKNDKNDKDDEDDEDEKKDEDEDGDEDAEKDADYCDEWCRRDGDSFSATTPLRL